MSFLVTTMIDLTLIEEGLAVKMTIDGLLKNKPLNARFLATVFGWLLHLIFIYHVHYSF